MSSLALSASEELIHMHVHKPVGFLTRCVLFGSRNTTWRGFAAVLLAAGLSVLPSQVLADGDDDSPASATEENTTVTLSDAAADGNISAARAILARGVHVDTRFAGQHTALMAAASYGQTAMVRFLLARGANPSLRDASGRTAAIRARSNNHNAIADLIDKASADNSQRRRVPAPSRPATVPVQKRQSMPSTAAKPPLPGKAPSEAFLRQMVIRYYQMTANGTLTAPLRIDVRINRFTIKPVQRNKVSVIAGRVYRVNDAAPPNALLYPIAVSLTTTEYYRTGAPTQRQYNWEFDAFNQRSGMVTTGGWILSSKGPMRTSR
jgi:hypothetical protein